MLICKVAPKIEKYLTAGIMLVYTLLSAPYPQQVSYCCRAIHSVVEGEYKDIWFLFIHKQEKKQLPCFTLLIKKVALPTASFLSAPLRPDPGSALRNHSAAGNTSRRSPDSWQQLTEHHHLVSFQLTHPKHVTVIKPYWPPAVLILMCLFPSNLNWKTKGKEG